MTCCQCSRSHAVMWTYRIRVGRTVVERAFCNRCELERYAAA